MKAWTKNVSAPNACLYLGGPTVSEMYEPDPADRILHQHVRARFRNTQVAFVLANIDRAPPTATTLHFDVHGGFRQESVVFPATVQMSAPARLVLGPIDSNPASTCHGQSRRRRSSSSSTSGASEPGRAGGPTRGQIVRVNPFGLATNGYLPVYEDYHAQRRAFPDPVTGRMSQSRDDVAAGKLASVTRVDGTWLSP